MLGSLGRFSSWSAFLDGHTYKGVYRPKVSATSAQRDNFKSMARKLKDEQIPYTLLWQVWYDTNTAGTYADPAEVIQMRCDGVVEYVYEWYNFKVFGNSTNWDVTKNSLGNRAAHSGTAITPESQAVSYLTKVSSGLP